MYYIGKRHNPQLSRVYYRALGELNYTQKKSASAPLYGTQTLMGYATIDEYLAACNALEKNGERIIF